MMDSPHVMSESSSNSGSDKVRRSANGSPETRAAAIDVTAHVGPTERAASDAGQQAALAALREAALRAAGVLPHPNLPPGEQPRFWLKRTDQVLVAGLLVLATALMTVHWVRVSDWGRRPVEIARLPAQAYTYRIDINRATWVEWAQFDGIGETLARRIVDDRAENGPFRSVDDLLRVRGIGRVRLEAMRRHLEIEDSAVSK